MRFPTLVSIYRTAPVWRVSLILRSTINRLYLADIEEADGAPNYGETVVTAIGVSNSTELRNQQYNGGNDDWRINPPLGK